jgi:hypothetical protein
VFADKAYVQGERIELCHVVIVPAAQVPWLVRTSLDDYAFAWSDGALALPSGLGMLYNHSASARNMRLVLHVDESTLEFVALYDISPGDELTFDYDCQLSFVPAR